MVCKADAKVRIRPLGVGKLKSRKLTIITSWQKSEVRPLQPMAMRRLQSDTKQANLLRALVLVQLNVQRHVFHEHRQDGIDDGDKNSNTDIVAAFTSRQAFNDIERDNHRYAADESTHHIGTQTTPKVDVGVFVEEIRRLWGFFCDNHFVLKNYESTERKQSQKIVQSIQRGGEI